MMDAPTPPLKRQAPIRPAPPQRPAPRNDGNQGFKIKPRIIGNGRRP